MSKPKKKRTSMPLPVRLTDAELKARGEELARVMDEIDVSQSIVDDAKAQHRVVAERCNDRIGTLRTILRTGFEDRETSTVQRRNLERSMMETWRLDTGEIVASRPLEESERGTDWIRDAELREEDLDADEALGRTTPAERVPMDDILQPSAPAPAPRKVESGDDEDDDGDGVS